MILPPLVFPEIGQKFCSGWKPTHRTTVFSLRTSISAASWYYAKGINTDVNTDVCRCQIGWFPPTLIQTSQTGGQWYNDILPPLVFPEISQKFCSGWKPTHLTSVFSLRASISAASWYYAKGINTDVNTDVCRCYIGWFPPTLIQTSQTGGQWYSDTSPFSIP